MRKHSLFVAGLLISASAPAQDTLFDQAFQQSVREQLDGLAGLGFGGVFLVANGERVVFEGAFGLADRKRGVAFRTDHLIPIASISKGFAAASALRLIQNGKLRLEDSIGKHLPSVPQAKRAITIHHLLCHASGLPTYLPFEFHEMKREQAIAQCMSTRLRFAPGTSYGYSNAGYTLLAAIVEEITKEPFQEHVRRELLDPNGMFETRWYSDFGTGHERTPNGYGDEDNGASFEEWPAVSWRDLGSGGMVSTVRDLHRWMLAWRGTQLLGPRIKELAWTTHQGRAGYGWFIDTTRRKTRRLEHGGSSDKGYSCLLSWDRDEDLLQVLALNTSDALFRGFGCHHALADRLDRVVHGKRLPVPPAGARANLSQQRGSYNIDGTSSFTIRERNGQWVLAARGQAAVNALLPLETSQFASFRDANKRSSDLMMQLIQNVEQVSTLPALRKRWRGWLRSLGKPTNATVLGTTPTWTRQNRELMTYVEISFGQKKRIIRLYWRDARLVTLGGATYDAPLYVHLIDTGEHYRSFHLGLPDVVDVRFDTEGSQPVIRVGDRLARKES